MVHQHQKTSSYTAYRQQNWPKISRSLCSGIKHICTLSSVKFCSKTRVYNLSDKTSYIIMHKNIFWTSCWRYAFNQCRYRIIKAHHLYHNCQTWWRIMERFIRTIHHSLEITNQKIWYTDSITKFGDPMICTLLENIVNSITDLLAVKSKAEILCKDGNRTHIWTIFLTSSTSWIYIWLKICYVYIF